MGRLELVLSINAHALAGGLPPGFVCMEWPEIGGTTQGNFQGIVT